MSAPTSPPLTDVAVRAWAPVTVRVAWTLRSEGIRVHPETLRDVRDHVLLHLDPALDVDAAEDRAEHLARIFVARALQRPLPKDPWPEDRALPLRRAWRDQLYRALSRNQRWVLLQHFADGVPLDVVAQRLGEDPSALEATREGLREQIRAAARLDGVDLDGWPPERLDGLLHRLAQMAAEPSPPLLEVVDGLHPEHCTRCVRSARAFKLVRSQELRRADLVPPESGARPTDRVAVLALGFHPDGRRHRVPLLRELGVRSFPVGDDLLLLDAADAERVAPVLRLAAEVGAPHRDHLRGVRVEGLGRWSRHGVVGPVVEVAQEAVRSVTWGLVDGVGELPAPLPRPPSALPLWAAVAGLALVTGIAVRAALAAPEPVAVHPLRVEAVADERGQRTWVAFDVDEEANVYVVGADAAGTVELLLDGSRAAHKASVAVGDGSYRLSTRLPQVLVVSSARPVPGFDALLLEAAARPDALDWIAEQVRAVDPRADIRRVR